MSSLRGHQTPPPVQQNEPQVMPPNPPLPYVTDQGALKSLCHTLRQSPRLALDTEFVGQDPLIPRFELTQVPTATTAAVIDFPAVQASGSLDVFWELICDTKIEKIVHAGRQDLDLFAIHAGQIPKPFFDTQIAAAMVGYGAQVSYANLVQRLHGTKLAKAHTFTNWSARPLSDDQIAYALEDVEFLLSIHTHLQDRLSSLGRLEGVSEEFACHPPKSVNEFRGLRGIHSSEVDRHGGQLLATITSTLALPPSAWPEVPCERKPDPESTGIVELLQAVLKARAAEEGIAPTMLATSADLQILVEAKQNRIALDMPILCGWRPRLPRDLLLRVLDG